MRGSSGVDSASEMIIAAHELRKPRVVDPDEEWVRIAADAIEVVDAVFSCNPADKRNSFSCFFHQEWPQSMNAEIFGAIAIIAADKKPPFRGWKGVS